MKPRLLFLSVLAALTLAGAAAAEQTEDDGSLDVGGLSVSSELNLTLTQNAYSDNWAGSEGGSASWAASWNTLAESQLAPTYHLSSSLKLAFGQTHSQDPETNRWRKPVKSTDLVDFDTVVRLTHGWAVDPFAGARVETQFLDESDPANKRELNPAVFTESFGVARMFIKDERRELSVRIGGALKQHVVREAAIEEGDGKATTVTTDAGVELVSLFRTP